MSDPRVETIVKALEDAESCGCTIEEIAAIVAERLDAASSQYEARGFVCTTHGHFSTEGGHHTVACHYEPVFRRIEYSTGTRALIDNRTSTETAEAKAWSDDAHAQIRAGEVSGSHDLMREKVDEYRANTETKP